MPLSSRFRDRLLFPLLLAALPFVAEAQFSYVTNNGTITITRYVGPGGVVAIPDTIAGLPVTGIGGHAFELFGSLTSVAIPATVTNIADLAFYFCPSLTAILVDPLNPAYSSVDEVLFNQGQTMLVQFPGSKPGDYIVPDTVTLIGGWAFNWCTSLTNITFPGSVMHITNSAFCACYSLRTITVEPSNAVYSSLDGVLLDKSQTTLLYYPLEKIGNYIVPNSIISIADRAFQGHSKLTGVALGNSVTHIGTEAFHGCDGLTGFVMGGSITSIGDGAFTGCTTLTNLTMPDSLTNIGDRVFWSCINLRSLVLPDAVTSIGQSAFQNCSSLTNVVLGPNVTSIGDWAFSGCVSLTDLMLGSNVTNIGAGAFYDCESLTTFTIPDSVISLGRSAFEHSTSLTRITLGSNLRDIGISAFASCVNLTNATIPHSVTNIGNYAFYGCNRLTSLVISTNLFHIGDGVFSSCTSLASVEIPASVTSIGRAFVGCSSLARIIVDPLNPVYSGFDGVLFDKNGTTLIQCPEGKIGSYTTPDSVTVIADGAFAYCRGLTNVVLGRHVSTLGRSAFLSCDYLTRVTMPTTVTNIVGPVFSYCRRLEAVYWQGNAPTFAFSVFYDSHPTVYYLPGTTGWGPTFGGRPTALWLPTIQASDATFGIHDGRFGFTINWATGMTNVIEACTNLGNPAWSAIGTNVVSNDGTVQFTDPDWANYLARFYRVQWP